MTSEEKFEYWLDSVQYDLDTANSNFLAGRWLYVVLMYQQAIEKPLKDLHILYLDDNIPFIHDLNK
jgi:HEPN domain-containing protein